MANPTHRRIWLARAGGWLALAALGGVSRAALAKVPAHPDKLVVTLEKGQALAGTAESFKPVAQATSNAPAIYTVVGDLRMQFWFLDEKLSKDPDAYRRPAEVRPATFAELRAPLQQPEQAIRKALANMGRMWLIPPTAAALLDPARPRGEHSGGLIGVPNVFGMPQIAGSWMLDRALWKEMAAARGPIVATVARETIAYAPLRDAKAMEWLEGTHTVNIDAELALSKQLYVFEKDRWAVFAKSK